MKARTGHHGTETVPTLPLQVVKTAVDSWRSGTTLTYRHWGEAERIGEEEVRRSQSDRP